MKIFAVLLFLAWLIFITTTREDPETQRITLRPWARRVLERLRARKARL